MPQPTMFLPGELVTFSGRKCEVVRGINRGGSAEVYEVIYRDSRYALKIFYPFYYEQYGQLNDESFKSIVHMQENECGIIRSLAHPGIVRVFDNGLYKLRPIEAKRLDKKALELPYILEEFVDGDQISKVLAQSYITQEDVCGILNRICSALLYVHKRKYLHCDLKADNVLVRRETRDPVLIDFGLAKDLSFTGRPRDRVTPVLGDWDLMPWLTPDHPLKRMREQASGSAGELFDLAFPTLDIYNFGQLLKHVLEKVGHSLERSARDYLQLLAEQLTVWEIARTWTSEMLADRVSRLSPTRYSLLGIPELAPPTTTVRTIMIPPDVGVPVTRRLQAFLNNRSFRRLSHINQLGLLSFIYPGADYKRQLHVLHTYHLCRLLVLQLYSNSIFRLHFGETAAIQLLIMSLLHDINHFPFLHVFQEARIEGLKELDLVSMFCSGDITAEAANGEPSIRELLSEIDLDLSQFTRLIFKNQQSNPAHQIISSVINSGADVDKMSYLFLDGHFTGVPFGRGLDLAGLLKSATVAPDPSSGALHLAFYDRGLQAVENLALTRLWHFRSMYWHHTNRALMAMLLDVVKTLYTGSYSIRDYVVETMWKSDLEVLQYLNGRYFDRFQRSSVLGDLPQNRNRIFKRLYTVHGSKGDRQDELLFEALSGLSQENERRLRREIAHSIASRFPQAGFPAGSFDERDVLIDVPRDNLSTGGQVYMVMERTGETVPLERMSKVFEGIGAEYERLTKRVRLFLSPALVRGLPEDYRSALRQTIYGIIREVLDGVQRQVNQVT